MMNQFPGGFPPMNDPMTMGMMGVGMGMNMGMGMYGAPFAGNYGMMPND